MPKDMHRAVKCEEREDQRETKNVTFSGQTVEWKEQQNLLKLSKEAERLLGA